MNYLISGINSGLGKYLYYSLNCSYGFSRHSFKKINRKKKYDTIIHCGFNKKFAFNSSFKNLVSDNIILTQDLLKLNYSNFIYISSIDVYSKSNNLYVIFKKIAESLVLKEKNTSIMRCGMLIGDTMRHNHIIKIYKNEKKISLSEKSKFNYILMSDILKYIEKYSKKNHKKICDFVSNKSISLKNVKKILNSKTSFGKFVYSVPKEFTFPVFREFKEFDESSQYNLKHYFNII